MEAFKYTVWIFYIWYIYWSSKYDEHSGSMLLIIVMVTILVDGDTLKTDTTGITDIELGNSYRCMNGITYNLTSQNSTVLLTLTDLQIQAFNFTKQKEFGNGL